MCTSYNLLSFQPDQTDSISLPNHLLLFSCVSNFPLSSLFFLGQIRFHADLFSKILKPREWFAAVLKIVVDVKLKLTNSLNRITFLPFFVIHKITFFPSFSCHFYFFKSAWEETYSGFFKFSIFTSIFHLREKLMKFLSFSPKCNNRQSFSWAQKMKFFNRFQLSSLLIEQPIITTILQIIWKLFFSNLFFQSISIWVLERKTKKYWKVDKMKKFVLNIFDDLFPSFTFTFIFMAPVTRIWDAVGEGQVMKSEAEENFLNWQHQAEKP